MSRAADFYAGADEPTTVGALIGELAAIMNTAGVAEAGREAREIIAAMKDAPRFWPTVNAHVEMTVAERRFAREAATRRAAGAPIPDIVWGRPDGSQMQPEDWDSGFGRAIGVFLNGYADRLVIQ